MVRRIFYGILFSCVSTVLLCGCSTWRINKLVKKLKQDPIIPVENGPAQLSPTMKELVAAGSKAVRPLLNALNRDEGDLRFNIGVMVVLDAMGSEVPAKTFIRLLTHPGLGVSGCAAETLKARLDVDLTKPLVEFMGSVDPALHAVPHADTDAFRFAIDCLAEVGTEEAIGSLITVIDHPDAESRRRAMQAVLRIAIRHDMERIPAKAMGKLVANLADSDGNVRYLASYVLTGLTGEKFGTLSPGGDVSVGRSDREIKLKWETWWVRNRARYTP
ncbi:MAG: HEAT repeat domain-containing protein [Planctomycetota bacterium]|jgi:HEAT repeat protein